MDYCCSYMSSDYVSRGIHTSSDPGLQVKFPHPLALTLRCLSGSNDPVYSVLIRCFEIEFSSIKKGIAHLFGSFLPPRPSFVWNTVVRQRPCKVGLERKNRMLIVVRTNPASVLPSLFEMRTTQPLWELSPIRTNPIHDGDSK